jgi:predicted transcriptional regulator
MQEEKSKIKGEKSMSGPGIKDKPLAAEQLTILKAMADVSGPCGSKDIAAATGLETKVMSSRITALKKKGLVASPVRCKYTVTDEGKAVIG